jgi:predicted AAA+ superfamily ATPase
MESEAVCSHCHPQALFEEYLRVGYYPFYDGDEQEYYSRIENVVSFIIDQEMTQFCGVEASYTRKLKAMMLFLANNLPYDVNIAKLSSYLELNKSTVLSYLSSMKRAELLHLLYADNMSVTKMQKPDKIYLDNSNLLYMLCTEKPEIGTVRETFFANQLASAGHTLEYAGYKKGDFRIDGNTVIEVGGADKGFSQITDTEKSFVAADDIESASRRKIPLWAFGFLY